MRNRENTYIALALTASIGLFVFGYFFLGGVFGGTTLNVTIATNPDLENGLVGHWSFDGSDVNLNSSTAEITDISGQGNNGDWQDHSTTTAPGALGQAIDFDGIDDFVSLGTSVNFDGASALSVSMWIKKSDAGNFDGHRGLFSIGDTNQRVPWIWGRDTTDTIRVQLETTTGGVADCQVDSNSITDEVWTHVIFSWDGSTCMLYENGSSTVSDTTTGNILPNEDLEARIGYINTFSYWQGMIDDVRIYDRALSTSSVKRLYDLGATTRVNKTLNVNPNLENGFFSHWTFDGILETIIADRVGSNDGYFGATSQATSSMVRPGRIGQGIKFDGSADDIIFADFTTPDPATIVAWVKLDGTSGSRSIFGGELNTVQFRVRPDERIELAKSNAGIIGTGTNSISIGEWNHVVVTYETSGPNIVWSFYINGSIDNSGTTAGAFVHAGSHNIGSRAGGIYFSGDMDDIRYYSRVLSAKEIERLYDLGATTHVNKTIDTNPDLKNGLIGHWTLDGPFVVLGDTSSEIKYSGSSGYNGNWLNHNSEVRPGKIGQAIEFDGSTQEILISDSADDGLTGMSEITLSAWVKYTSSNFGAGTEPGIIGKDESGDRSYAIYIVESTDKPYAIFSDDGSNRDRIDFNTAVSIGEWNHIATTWDGSTIISYVNGVEDKQQATSAATGALFNNTAGFSIGAPWSGTTSLGTIDDVRIYNRALSAEDIKRLYELGS